MYDSVDLVFVGDYGCVRRKSKEARVAYAS